MGLTAVVVVVAVVMAGGRREQVLLLIGSGSHDLKGRLFGGIESVCPV